MALKRGVELRDLAELQGDGYVLLDHKTMPFIFAAYKRGVFAGDTTMDSQAFHNSYRDFAQRFLMGGGSMVVMVAKTEKGRIPVGMVAFEAARMTEPTFIWFPEASDRNILESTIRFLVDIKGEQMMGFFAEEDDEQDLAFFQHLFRFGVIRKIGKVRDYFGVGKHAVMFQTVGV